MINQDEIKINVYRTTSGAGLLCAVSILIAVCGCAMQNNKLVIKELNKGFAKGTIVSAKTGGPVSFDSLMADLNESRLIYIGEVHTLKSHHDIQLMIIKGLYGKNPDLAVGMEMFDGTYQPLLDKWSEGSIDTKTFIERSHWYANWKYDFKLYEDILGFLKEKRIKLIGLNIPFHIPAKISTGGTGSLPEDDKKHLPGRMNMSNKAHREYVENIFLQHKIKGRDDFEKFYEAQCVWDEAMAEAAAGNLKNGVMIVIAGNGHILRYGIPERAFARNGLPYRTIFLAPAGTAVSMGNVDYIWVTP
jgi:uncharacterized iron-regulated protein